VSGAVDPDAFPWEAWRPDEARRRLEGVEPPWCVAAGWAIDLFLGGERREHSDLELAAPAARFDEIVTALGGLEPFVIGPDPHASPPEEASEQRMAAIPLAAATDVLAETHQTWLLDRSAPAWRLDVFREPSAGGEWVCRRDGSIRLPYAEVIETTADGIPYLRPELVLLFKARHAHEPKNADDLAAVLAVLEPSRRRWLGELLARVHPGHAWIAEVERR
jgi:hypothetical protein